MRSYSIGLLEKAAADADYAPGLPDPEEYGDIKRLQELKRKLTDLTIQKHLAEQAGKHFDIRVKGPEGLYSWALPKAQLPEPGQTRLAIRQPIHAPEYADFEGEIPEGYGKGTVTTAQRGKVLFTNFEKDKEGDIRAIDFTYDTGSQIPERFKLKKMNRTKEWLLINTTPTKPPEAKKPRFKRIEDKDDLEDFLSKVSKDRPASVKIDGALGLLKFMKDKAEVMSYRTSKKTEGPIFHTERIAPQLLEKREIPENLVGKTFWGEMFATTPEGKALPAQKISGILNSAVSKALKKQEDEDISFQMALFKVLSEDGEASEEGKLLDEAIKQFPGFLRKPPIAQSPGKARELLERVQKGEHPLSSEGMVFKTPEGRYKYKFGIPETDVIIQRVFPGQGKYEGSAAGGFEYSLVPGGKVVGKVGTGLSDELRREMWENPEKFQGRVAKIQAQKQYPSGAFRAPAFLSLHEDYPHEEGGKKEWGPEIQSRM